MSTTVQLRSRGVLTLPKALREKYDIEEGDALRLLDVGGTFVLMPLHPMVPELAQEIERLREEAGLSTEEMLARLRENRGEVVADRFGEELGRAGEADE